MKRALAGAALGLVFMQLMPAEDWTEWRGPRRDGTSAEKNLPSEWSVEGKNLLWRAPFGARSTPVIFGNRIYLMDGAGSGETLQERMVCLDADTGKVVWEYRWNLYLSDVPPHRIAWASPAVDAETGNVIAFGGNGTLLALSPQGKLLWKRSLAEDYSLFTTHGGRTASPLIDGGLVIVSAVSSTWGEEANRSHRVFAFDKKTGATVWVSTPGGRPYDTSYSNPIITEVDGRRLMITGLGDGSVVAVKPQTGEPVWRVEIAKRGINTAVVMAGGRAIVTHGDENLESNVMGMIAAVDVRGSGALGADKMAWAVKGFEEGYSSPLAEGDVVYGVDNGSNLVAFDAGTGAQLWKKNLGTLQKASPVLADGKIYVGTESGHFFILKVGRAGAEVLSDVVLPVSQTGIYSAGTPEPVVASAAVSNGRVYFASVDALYCLSAKAGKAPVATLRPQTLPAGRGAVAHVQVRPSEVVIKPGETVALTAYGYDADGRLIGQSQAAWTQEGLEATIAGGKLTAGKAGKAGYVVAEVGGVKGKAKVRVAPVPPYEDDFSSYAEKSVPPHWVSAQAGRYTVTELEGNKVLFKEPNQTLFRRMRVFFGPNDLSDYTVQCDVRFPERRRQLGDGGVFAQRYGLILFGANQRVELQGWQPETKRTVSAPYSIEKDTWYTVKLRVENQAGGKVLTQGKVWKRGEAEPAAWLVERVDPIGNREGSPGIFGDAEFGVYYDNLKVTANK